MENAHTCSLSWDADFLDEPGIDMRSEWGIGLYITKRLSKHPDSGHDGACTHYIKKLFTELEDEAVVRHGVV